MAETAKILNPAKTVLLPNLAAGCSLADSITGETLAERREELRKVYPDLAVVTYVNTTAEVKAESDVCCTSSNAVRIVESLPTENILFTPDENLAAYVQSQTGKNVIAWNGSCYVHQQIRPEHIRRVREAMPEVRVIAHPECRSDVLALADAVLSTSGMVDYARQSTGRDFLVVTECGLSDRLLLELPEKRFYKACKLCQYMVLALQMGSFLAKFGAQIFVSRVVGVSLLRELAPVLTPLMRGIRREGEAGADADLEHLRTGRDLQAADRRDDARIEKSREDAVVKMRELVVNLALVRIRSRVRHHSPRI